MRVRYFYWAALACASFGTNVMAQPSSPVSTAIPVSIQQTITTGMVGFTSNQSARLSVLNVNPIPATANARPNCTVELQFFDPQNHSLKESLVPNFAPQTAASLDLTRAEDAAPPVASQLRAQIRGAVTVNPAPTPGMSPAAVGYCGVMVTLETFDEATGSTIALTTDTRMIGTGGIVPWRNWTQSAVPK